MDQNYIGIEGLEYPENGSKLFQEDFIKEQDALGKEVVNRERDYIVHGIIYGLEVTVSSTPGCVTISNGAARDALGRRIEYTGATDYALPDNWFGAIIVKHQWIEEGYIPEGDNQQKIIRRHESTIALKDLEVGEEYSPLDDEVLLAYASRNQSSIVITDKRIFVHYKRLYTENKKIMLNYTESGQGVGGDGISGIIIDRGMSNPAKFIFDETDDTFKVGINSLDTIITQLVLDKIVPIGGIIMYGGGNVTDPAPVLDNFLYCDGSAISRTTFANLFNTIGTTFGAGNGTTTFNIPNFKAVVPRGMGTQTINTREKNGGNLGALLEDRIQQMTGQLGQPWESLGADVKSGVFNTSIFSSTGFAAGGGGIYISTILIKFDASQVARTGDYTRDNSLSIRFYIRYI